MSDVDPVMTAAHFLSWCQQLSEERLTQVQLLLTSAAATFEDAPLGALRYGVRRTLENCWRVGAYNPDGALELMRSEMVAYAQ